MVITIYCIPLVVDPGLIRGEYANPCWHAPTCYLAKEIAENSMKMKEIGWGGGCFPSTHPMDLPMSTSVTTRNLVVWLIQNTLHIVSVCCIRSVMGFLMQGLFVPFACVGSGDPVRVLCLYTRNTLDTL